MDFHNLFLKTNKIYSSWNYTTISFTWNWMLRKTNIKLELLTDKTSFN